MVEDDFSQYLKELSTLPLTYQFKEKNLVMKIEYFEAGWDTVAIRFFLMMAVIIVGIFIGQYWMAALGLPIFLSALMAVKVSFNTPKSEAKISRLDATRKVVRKRAA